MPALGAARIVVGLQWRTTGVADFMPADQRAPPHIPIRSPHCGPAVSAGCRRCGLAKTAGLIEKLPNGRKPRGSPKRSANRVIARAQRVLEERTMMLSGKDTGAALPAAAPGEPAVAAGKARNAMSKSEKQSANTDLALDVNHAVLSAPVDLNDLKRARLQVDCAVSTINQQVRIDQAQMRQQSEENAVAILMRRLAQHDVGTPVTHDGYPPGGVEKDAAAPPPGSSPRRG